MCSNANSGNWPLAECREGHVPQSSAPQEDPSAAQWKAEQRDWLVAKLRRLRDQWLAESEKKESYLTIIYLTKDNGS